MRNLYYFTPSLQGDKARLAPGAGTGSTLGSMNQAVDAIKKGNKVTIFCLPNEQSQFEVARRSGAEIKVVKK